jgi:hypothetical protein
MEVLAFTILDQVGMVVAAMMTVHQAVTAVDHLHWMSMIPVTMVLQDTADLPVVMVVLRAAMLAHQ